MKLGEKEGEQDKALTVLKQPDRYSDGDVFDALCAVSAVKTGKSPVITKHGDEGRRLFAELWRYMLRHVSVANIGFFRMCFGEQKELRWYPLCNAVYWQPEPYADTEYVLNENHSFLCRDGVWFERVYPRLYFNRQLLNDFLHEADRLLRVYLKTGRPLKQRESAAWAEPHISAFIRADRQAKIEAARPKIKIRFSQLDRIRRDATVTRDSLLTEEETAEQEENTPAAEQPVNALTSDLLSDVQLQIMQLLLNGESVRAFIGEHHLMPSVVADAINEALFDEIGDTVLECDGGELSLTEDYIEEIKELLGG